MPATACSICSGVASYVTPMRIFTRRLGRASMLSTTMLAIVELGTLTSVFSKVRMRVERKPISSTTPSNSPVLIQSPTVKGRSTRIMMEPKTLAMVSLAAMATAMPPMPSEARRPEME